MARTESYLVTVDSETGTALRVEHVGAAGELSEVPLKISAVDASGTETVELEFPGDPRKRRQAEARPATLRFVPKPVPREVRDAGQRTIQYWGPERPVLGPREGRAGD